jgi:ATP-binding cassette subfamily B protein
VVLEAGRVAQIGSHEDLLRQDGLYRRLWMIQSSLEEELSLDEANGAQAADDGPDSQEGR